MPQRPTIFTPAYYEALEEVETHPWVRHIEAVQSRLLRWHAGAAMGLRFFDAGCGTGGYALRHTSDFAHRAGLDRAPEAARRAHLRGLPTLLASVSELPVATASVDCLLSADVLQHLPEAEMAAALAECWRVLRPGGTLAVRTSHRKGLGANQHRDAVDYRQFEAGQLRALLAGSGFGEIRTYRANVLPALLADWRTRGHPAPVGDTGFELSAEAAWKTLVLRAIWAVERFAMLGLRLPMPYGHTLFACARKLEAG